MIAHDLAVTLYALAARVQSGSLLPWQVARLTSALAPELAVLARCDERGHEPNRYRCRLCGETRGDLGALRDHGRDAHGVGLDGAPMLRGVA